MDYVPDIFLRGLYQIQSAQFLFGASCMDHYELSILVFFAGRKTYPATNSAMPLNPAIFQYA